MCPSSRAGGCGQKTIHGNTISALPPSYGKTDRRFPVLWVTDGQYLFQLATALVTGCAHQRIPEMIGDMKDPLHYIRLSERVRIEDRAYASSPSARIESWRAPTLFTMGDLDLNGHMESVIDLGYQLLARGVPVEFYVDPAGEHNVFPQERVFEFFERTLK